MTLVSEKEEIACQTFVVNAFIRGVTRRIYGQIEIIKKILKEKSY